MSIGKRLVIMRETRKWSQQQVAERIGISRASYSQYEIDRREPSFEISIRLADTFQVTLDYLVRGAEPEFEYQIAKREFSNLIEDYIGPSLFVHFQSLSPSGRMWVIDELDAFVQLEHRRELSMETQGGKRQ